MAVVVAGVADLRYRVRARRRCGWTNSSPCLLKRTEFSDAYYAALGRALAFCINFERNCRGLWWLVRVPRDWQSGDQPASKDDPIKLAEEAFKGPLKQRVDQLAKILGGAQDLVRLLDGAREARNAIAHEVAVEIDRDVDSVDGRARRLAELRGLIGQVAEADAFVCLVSQALQQEELPGRNFLARYQAQVASWVCDVDDDPVAGSGDHGTTR